MSDIARDMLRMYGLGMGLDVESNQRLAKARELRHREELDAEDEERVETPDAPEPTVVLRRRAITGSVPWIPRNPRVK